MTQVTESTEGKLPQVSEDNGSIGDIRINNSVVASIVRIAAVEIDGVYSVGSSIVEGITEIFSKKESERGVRVAENEAGEYEIEVRVILRFGVELAKVAVQIQENVRRQVTKMTMKPVAKIDVVIDGVRNDEPTEEKTHSLSSSETTY